MMDWTANLSAIAAAFSASFVEFVEASTIVLAVYAVRGPKPALLGALACLLSLVLIVAIVGHNLGRLPMRTLQLNSG
jgi:Ca2+/H+ antiporter, TMEM165/GDT1 family